MASPGLVIETQHHPGWFAQPRLARHPHQPRQYTLAFTLCSANTEEGPAIGLAENHPSLARHSNQPRH